jgi:hypothetical protein
MTDSATMLLDPTQMPPGAELVAGAAELGGDILVLDDESPAAAPTVTEPVHRVERKDLKSLFARLRG